MDVPATKPLCLFIKALILAVSIFACAELSAAMGWVATSLDNSRSALISCSATLLRSVP